jgi:hypothetical protein
MYFFHFSGYTPEGSEISDYLPGNISRHHFSNRQDLLPLFDEYEKMVIRNGHRTAMTWPYTFATFETGETIPIELRIQYRQCPSDWQTYGNPFNSKRLKARAKAPTTSNDTEILTGSEDNQTELLTAESTPIGHLAAAEELNKILNSRAWRWASHYGRFKYRFLIPIYDLLRRSLRKKARSNQTDS